MSGAHHHRAAAWELYFTTTARLTERIEAALKCQSGLSMPEYSVLLMTDRAGEAGIRPSVLAHKVVFSRSRLTHTAKRMENQGLLRRERANDDRRGVVASLTDEGMALLVEAAPTHVRSVRDILIDVATPDDLRALGRVMGAVLEVAD